MGTHTTWPTHQLTCRAMFEVMCCISCHVIVIEGNFSEDRIFHLDLGRLPAFMFVKFVHAYN